MLAEMGQWNQLQKRGWGHGGGRQVSLPPASSPLLIFSQRLHLQCCRFSGKPLETEPRGLASRVGLHYLFSLKDWDADSLRWRHPVCRKINRQLKQGCESEKTTGLRASDNARAGSFCRSSVAAARGAPGPAPPPPFLSRPLASSPFLAVASALLFQLVHPLFFLEDPLSAP